MMEIISDLQRVVEWCQFSFGCLFGCSFLRMYALLQSEQETNHKKIVRRMMKLSSGFLLGKQFKQALLGVMSCMFLGWIYIYIYIFSHSSSFARFSCQSSTPAVCHARPGEIQGFLAFGDGPDACFCRRKFSGITMVIHPPYICQMIEKSKIWALLQMEHNSSVTLIEHF